VPYSSTNGYAKMNETGHGHSVHFIDPMEAIDEFFRAEQNETVVLKKRIFYGFLRDTISCNDYQ